MRGSAAVLDLGELAAGGASVVIHGRHLAAAAEVDDQVRKLNVHSNVILADLSVAEECRRLVMKLLAARQNGSVITADPALTPEKTRAA